MIVSSTCVSVHLKGKENSYVSSGLDSQFLMYVLQKQGFLVLGKGLAFPICMNRTAMLCLVEQILWQ